MDTVTFVKGLLKILIPLKEELKLIIKLLNLIIFLKLL